MSEKSAYRTTAKGTSELSAKPGALNPGLKGLLAAVGKQASADDLRAKFPRAGNIDAALTQLARDGYIEPVPAQPAAKTDDKSLDFGNFFNDKPKEPTLHQLKQAEGTMAGSRRLKSGYQINILNRPGKPIPARGGGKHVVLLIDCHEAEALVGARSLMQAGFDVRGAGNKPEIVAALGKKPLPDLIIMDVELNDAVGLDVLGKLHEHPEFKKTPIIVVTARAERDDIVAALAYGASGYLNKPLPPETLVRNAKDALGLQ